ncbi:hypothetical protein FBU31_000934 [Coemansia sp. 'formosensis']|nr:hypothetical protein FBU31_000934 [Coemansia sp. 'formosensis']
MVKRTAGENGGNKGFSLFSAFNGLFERARSSAEKESQRLFTSPIPGTRLAKERRLDRSEVEGSAEGLLQEQYTSHSGSPRSTLPETLAMAKRRPRPARSQSSRAGAPSRKRSTRSPPVHGSPIEEATVDTLPPLSATEIDDADNGRPHDAVDASAATPNTVSKRKRSVRRSPSPVLEMYSDSPKRSRTSAADDYAFSSAVLGATIDTQDLGPHETSDTNYRATPTPDYDAYAVQDYGVGRHSVELAQSPEADASAFPMPPVALQRTSTVSTAVSDSTYRFRNDASMPNMRNNEFLATRRATSYRLNAVPLPSGGPVEKLELPPRQTPTIAEPSPVVERGRLEKVERELHRLKKIIASLLPDELNDDDLRSVYGDLDQHQPRRLSSDDIIMQLMKTRLGAAASSRYSSPQPGREAMANLPPSPTSNSPTNYGLSAGSMPPSAGAPLAPPPPPMVSALLAGRANLHGREDAGRPRSVASLLRRDSTTTDASSMLGDHPTVHSATVRRLRAELRPLSPQPQATQKKLTPPLKDPGVMSLLLEEMKHHKLRAVAKPKDMAIH